MSKALTLQEAKDQAIKDSKYRTWNDFLRDIEQSPAMMNVILDKFTQLYSLSCQEALREKEEESYVKQDFLSVLEENYQASVRDSKSVNPILTKEQYDILIETYEDLIAIYKNLNHSQTH